MLCYGNSTGSVTLSASGSSGYTYKKDDGDYRASATFGTLAAGDYSFTVKDANNCQASTNATITQPASALSVSATASTSICDGDNLDITATPAGGTSPYSYEWTANTAASVANIDDDDAATTNVAPTATTTYTIIITDANNCQTSSTSTITVKPVSAYTENLTACDSLRWHGVKYTSSQTDGSVTAHETAANDCDSVVTLNLTIKPSTSVDTNATACGSFAWRGITYNATPLTAPTDTTTKANGCDSVVTLNLTINQSPTLTVGSQTNVLCYDGSTGSVTLSATGGTVDGEHPYQYKNGSGDWQASATFTSLATGNYTFTVKDKNNCQGTISTTITQPSELGLVVNHAASPMNSLFILLGYDGGEVELDCHGNLATLTFDANGGVGGYRFSKDNWTSSQSGADSNIFTNLAPGDYIFKVKDANNCEGYFPVTIIEPSALVLTATPTHALCNGGTGSVTLSSTGGTETVKYSDTEDGTYSASNTTYGSLSAGSHTFYAKDVWGCKTSATTTITQPDALALTGDVSTAIACHGGTATVTLSVTGGSGDYRFSKDNWTTTQSTGDSNVFTSLSASDYTFKVKDRNDCEATFNLTVTEPDELTLSGSQTNVLCYGGSTGSVTLSATGGTVDGEHPYQYKNGSGDWQTSATFGTLAADDYTFTVKDKNNCQGTLDVTITQPASALSATKATTGPLCGYDSPMGTIVITASGGTSPYQYRVDGDEGDYDDENTLSASVSPATHTYYVKDNNGCVVSAGFSIAAAPRFSVTFASDEITICQGETTTLDATVVHDRWIKNYTLTASPFGASAGMPGSTSGSENSNGTHHLTFDVSPTTTTVYTLSVQDNAGSPYCSIVRNVTVTVKPTSAYTENLTACDSLWWHDTKYTTAQTDGSVTYTSTGGAANGCDSITTLNLTEVYTTAHTAYTASGLGSYTWATDGDKGHGDGIEYNASGDYVGPEYNDANGCHAHDTLHLTITPINIAGVLNGKFSVAADKKVLFSQGNLQYINAPNDGYAAQSFRFALHQYDFVGGTSTTEPTGTFGNVYLENGTQCGNQNVSNSYTGWIDLFGWGTSKWNSGASNYMPYSTETTGSTYNPGGSTANNLTGDYANADWGVYNPIVNGGNTAGQFRVLTSDEWSYLLNSRTNATSKRSQGRINLGGDNYVKGVILLPDEWTLPTGCTFVTDFATNGYTTNTYTLEQWALMQANGAVFLPQAGRRDGTAFKMDNYYRSRYWSSTKNGENMANAFDFYNTTINPSQGVGRGMGNSVRLVFDDVDCVTSSGAVSETACDSYLWAANGVTYNASGTYTARIINRHGCDSTVTLTLTIKPSKHYTDNQTACDSLWWHSVKYTTTQTDGSVTFATTAANGCDSTVTLNLTAVYTTDHNAYNVSENGNYTWAASGIHGHGTGTNYTVSGDYVGPEYNDANGCHAHDTLHLTITASDNGCTLGGTFTVNASGDRIQFTCGNLQYRASTNEWRLAPDQWNYVGNGNGGYYAYSDDDDDYLCGSTKCNNEAISSSYCCWIDLFGFGTSGWNNSFSAYQPYSTSSTAGDYINQSLTGDYANADWGVYNSISGASAGTYRTMTSAEWQYILSGRDNAANKYGMGTLFGIYGIFFLPDEWTQPDGTSFTPGTGSGWTTNTYTTDAQWDALQAAGMVFLPMTGYRYEPGHQWTGCGSLSNPYGNYHTTTISATNSKHYTFTFYVYNSTPAVIVTDNDGWYHNNQHGYAVRLVKDFEPCEVVAPVKTVTACGSYTWPSTGQTYTGSTTVNNVTGIHRSPQGCDSIVSLNLTITPSSVYLSNSEQNIADGSPMSPSVVTASNFTIAVTDLPDGVTYNDATKTISGTPTGGEGTYTYTVTATSTNGCPTRVLTGTIEVGEVLIVPTGALNGAFSVAADKKVYFSKGNLQYKASTDTWRFAENQWNFVCRGSGYGNVKLDDNSDYCYNAYLSSTYVGWIDLFCYGTSGWNNGSTYYKPWDNNTSSGNNYLQQDLTGDYANADWGVYNAISNGGNAPGLWRTLTIDEWKYLLVDRANASDKQIYAKVNGYVGIILLPDDFTKPDGTPAYITGMNTNVRTDNTVCYTATNNRNNNSVNSFTLDQWALMEAAGAVFLPHAGYRNGTSTNGGASSPSSSINYVSYYWSATHSGTQYAYAIYWLQRAASTYTLSRTFNAYNKYTGASVRLVSDGATCQVFGPTTIINACDSYTWTENGQTYTESGDYTSHLTTSEGCDSVVTLHLTVGQSNSQAYYTTAVGSYIWTSDGDKGRGNGNTYTMSGTYVGPETTIDGCASADTLHLGISPIQGSTPGKFSVAAGKQVSFSQGNLQYLAKAADGYTNNSWRFAENQWNWVGDGSTHGNVYMADGTTPCDNTSISENDKVWIDMFGYACSGWDNGKTCYQPYHTTNTATYYLDQNLTSTYARGDWAFYNRIHNGGYNDSLWRTLTSAEMTFLLGTTSPRTANHKSFGTVNGVPGLIIMPDTWTLPNGCDYTGNITANFTTNTYTLEQWSRMETVGAIFLPQCYRRVQATAVNTGDGTYYWSSTSNGTSNSYGLKFTNNAITAASLLTKWYGGAIRPVYDLPTSCEIKYTTVLHEGCDKVVLDGENYYSNVDVVKRLVAHDGCDSLVTHRIIVKSSGSKNYYAQNLDSYTWPISGDKGHGTGSTYTETNTYVGPRYDGSNGCDAYDTLNLTITNIQGAIAHKFSVAVDKQVYFSNGNLQWQGSTNTWRFAEHQYTAIGNAAGNTTSAGSRASQSNWIDLFGYGTSGWSGSGATYYHPYDNSTTNSYCTHNLAGDYANADWGVYNAISNGGNVPELWRTLSKDEYNYLLNTRPGYADKKATAKIGNVSGVVLLPDDWVLPSGLTFVPGGNNTSSPANIYTVAQWANMEANGAVFLPLGGYRSNTSITPGYGYYWTSTNYSTSYSYRLSKDGSSAPTTGYSGVSLYYGHSVRLVVNAPTTCATRMTTDMGTETITNCGPYTYHGTTYYADTVTTVRFLNASGCDTLVRLTLTIKSTGDFYKVNPDGDSYTWEASGDKGHGTGETYDEDDAGIILGPTYTANGCTCRDTLKLSFTPPGRLSGLFSVSSTKQVYFSQGNLQYTTTGEHAVATGGTQAGTWRFAEHQYDFVGGTSTSTPSGTFGNVYVDAVQSGNQNVRNNYTGWIDLFGWGTSGWNSGATDYQAYSTTQTNNNYYGGASNTNSISETNADWGVFNAISNGGNSPGIWRTLTNDEWTYLKSTRTNAANKYAYATVIDVRGLVILPDEWVLPDGCSFTKWASNQAYTANNYNAEKWALMESNGAVFLPAAGYRGTGSASGTSWFYGSNYYGRYWSSSYYKSGSTYGAYQAPMFYSTGSVSNSSGANRAQGCSVRLVMDKE